jgi:hypothetical protein
MTRIDEVKRILEAECQGLAPDGDSLPTLLYRNGDDAWTVMGLAVDMDNDIAMLMTASLVLDEATEAFYSSFVWSVCQDRSSDTDADGRYHGPMPSQHPDRIEQAMIAHYTPDGMALYFATVTRCTDAPPVLGEWTADTFTKVTGRVARSIEGGLRMSAQLPDEMRSVFRMARAEGDDARKGALRGVLRAMKEMAS